MYLSRVEVKNFRSLEHLVADFGTGLNVIAGRNNVGKSNLLQAIRHAIGPSAFREEAFWLDRDDFFRTSPTDEAKRTIEVILTFSDLTDRQRAQFFEIVEFDLTDITKSKAVIRFEAIWNAKRNQVNVRRTGGPSLPEGPDVPVKILEALPITFLPALRDSAAALVPGYKNRLAMLLRDLAERRGEDVKTGIKGIFSAANHDLETNAFISATSTSLNRTARVLAGLDFKTSAIKASELEFEKILRTLQVQMLDGPVASLAANGLGYNNLLYMAVVLEHLGQADDADSPLLLVEEPEAHLHPQLVAFLADFLSNHIPGVTGHAKPQTIVSSHSPTFTASVHPDRINVMFSDVSGGATRCNRICAPSMTPTELDELQRMVDVTKAALYFARGIILVEGVSEALLVPALALRLGHNLARLHISVIPVCGVAFGTLAKILGPGALGVPVAILSDGDPECVDEDANWRTAIPRTDAAGDFVPSARSAGLVASFRAHLSARAFLSKVTLEYDLAEAAQGNAAVMATVWESCFQGTPRTFNSTLEAAQTNPQAKALATWRGICKATPGIGKGEFAHRLSRRLEECTAAGFSADFTVPPYIADAIDYVVSRIVPQTAPTPAAEPAPAEPA